MRGKTLVGWLALGYWLLAMPASAQLDASKLRAKYGSPLHRETFHLPRGFDLVVDYGPDNQVCKLEVPVEMPAPPQASFWNPRQDMQRFLIDLVPNWMRGKEVSHSMFVAGAFFQSYVLYERVSIIESGRGPGDSQNMITVQFKNGVCKP